MRKFSVVLAWFAAALSLGHAAAQERLIDQEPHDLLTVPDEKDTKTLSVYPIPLPNRRIPEKPKPTEKIKVRLLEDDESRDFEIFWRDVKKLELWEDRVLAEAEALAASAKLDEAYSNYAYLLKNYPNTLRLDESIQTYWYLSTGASFREKRYDEALAVLEELLQKNPAFKYSENSPSLMRVLGEVCDKLVQGYLEKKDYRSAGQLMNRITTSYPEARQESFYTSFKESMEAAAAVKRDEAREHLAAKRFTHAYDATAAMLDIWPSVAGGREVAIEMSETYPLAAIAVEQVAKGVRDSHRIDRWADLRVGRLIDRQLSELRGIGPEGGDYFCPLGKMGRSDDGRSLTISLSPSSPLPGFQVVQLLLSGAESESESFSSSWAQVLGGARVVRPDEVEATLRRPHVVPHALINFSLSQTEAGNGWSGTYEAATGEERLARYVQPAESALVKGKPREIQERTYPSPEAAILALQRGEVNAMDRIYPADLAAVRALPGVRVGRYAVPTLHVLIPNPDRPWPASRTFRRAIMYGIQRDAILNQGLLRDQELLGAQLISGPFPAPLTLTDPLAYAYDTAITPHTYEPLLTVTLVELAKREVEAEARVKNREPPPFGGIVIGYGPTESQRIACNAMVKQLTPLGIKCTAQLVSDDVEVKQCDFVYAELVVTEPVIDVERLFGPAGLYPATNPYVRLGVRQVVQAATWNQAGQRLRQLHRVLHEDLTVLPLWQMPEHFAVRPQVIQGVSESPVSLYQDIDQWRVAPRLGQE